MNSQKQTILNMLIDKEFVCVTEMMQAFIPDFRRRICDLKDDGYILMGKPCNLHNHKSKNLKMWHLISAPQDRKISKHEMPEYHPFKEAYRNLNIRELEQSKLL